MQEKQNSPSGPLTNQTLRFLDQIHDQIHRDPLAVSHTMSNLLQGLHKTRRELPPEDWKGFCKNVAAKHKLAEIVRQDPFTRHSVVKPRGYAGDAELLDYIYGYCKPETTALGKRIYEFTVNVPVCQAVRNRARKIAEIVDRLAATRSGVRVLSIASGHLREADMSQAVQQGRIAEYVAFDQDEASLAHVRERLEGKKVTTVHGSVADLLMGKHKELGGFDFVYAAGLYDYLTPKLATRMTTWMFKATRLGGLTLLTNYLRDIPGDGYMEAFMEWELIFRSPEELEETACRIPADQIAEKRTYTEEAGMVVFVELHKVARVRASVDLAFNPTPHHGLAHEQKAKASWGMNEVGGSK